MDTKVFFFPFDYETKLKIIRSIDRPVDEISIQEIADRCGISRQTFYRHFGSKDAMIVWHSLYARNTTLGELGHNFTWLDAYSNYFTLMAQEAEFHRNAVPRVDLHEIAIRYAEQVFLELLAQLNRPKTATPLDFYAHAQAILDVRLTVDWIRDGMETDPHELARLVVDCVPRPLFKALEPHRR
jgi:AcrR family transcriptional regulator